MTDVRDELIDELTKVVRWAVPLAEIAMEDHRIRRMEAGHKDITGTYKSGVTWVGIYQDEVDKIEDARSLLMKLNEIDKFKQMKEKKNGS